MAKGQKQQARKEWKIGEQNWLRKETYAPAAKTGKRHDKRKERDESWIKKVEKGGKQ